MAMQRTRPLPPPKPVRDRRPPKPAPKPKRVVIDPNTGHLVKMVSSTGLVSIVETTPVSEQSFGRRRAVSFSSKVVKESADTPEKDNDILLSSPNTEVKKQQRNMLLPTQTSHSKRRESLYEPELTQMLEKQDEPHSPDIFPLEEVAFATVGSGATPPMPRKKPLQVSNSAPAYSEKQKSKKQSSHEGKDRKQRFSILKKLTSSKTSAPDEQPVTSREYLSHKQAEITAKLQDHLHLNHKSEVMHYIGELNDDNDDSAYETASASSSGTSTPIGSLEDQSTLSSYRSSPALYETQENLSRTSRHTWFFDFSNENSPICLAIKNQWNIEPQSLPCWEQERIQAHCSRYLHSSYMFPDTDDHVSVMLQSYLIAYIPAFNELFPKTCETLKLAPPVWQQDAVKALQENEDLQGDESIEEVVDNVIAYFQKTEKTLMERVMDSAAINDRAYIARSNHYLRQIDTAQNLREQLGSTQEEPPSELIQSLQDDLQALEERFTQAATVTLQFERGDFRNEENWDQCIEFMWQTAYTYLEKNLKGDKLSKAQENLSSWFKDQKYPVTGIAKFIEELDAREKALLETLGISKKIFDQVRFSVLAQQNPQIRNKELYYLFEGQYHKVKVSHTPPACLTFGKGIEGNKDPLKLDGRFIPSCQRDADRAVNMSVTHVTMEGEDIMKEVRVGIPFAFAVSGGAARKATTLRRFQDILTVCGMTFFEDQMLSCFHATGTPSKSPMRLSVLNINLLSPDNLRPAFSSIPGIDNERLWCYKMEKRIGELNGKPLVLPVRRKDGMEGSVTVLPEIFMVVCPCNQLAYASSMQFTKTWENADKYNQKTFTHLFGELDPDKPISGDSYVQRFLNENPDLDPILKKELLELCDLIRYIFANKIHHQLGDQPFIFTTCLSELGRVMNMAIVSGCKSAKDRTGNYERSNIEMALRLHLVRKEMANRIRERYGDDYDAGVSRSVEQILPPIDRRMTTEDFYNHTMALLCTGQVEVTMECLGKPGFKIPDYMLGNFIKEVYPTVNGYLTADTKVTSN